MWNLENDDIYDSVMIAINDISNMIDQDLDEDIDELIEMFNEDYDEIKHYLINKYNILTVFI